MVRTPCSCAIPGKNTVLVPAGFRAVGPESRTPRTVGIPCRVGCNARQNCTGARQPLRHTCEPFVVLARFVTVASGLGNMDDGAARPIGCGFATAGIGRAGGSFAS